MIEFVAAGDIGLEPAHLRGHEAWGLVYFAWPDSWTIGAQCSHCHTILWTRATNAVLAEPRPSHVPESGPGYTAFVNRKTARFLASLPACPACGGRNYDRFVTNVGYPRFSTGHEYPHGTSSPDFVRIKTDVQVYFLAD